MVLNATNAVPVAGVVTTQLDSPYVINGLNFNVSSAGTTSHGAEHQRQLVQSMGGGGITLVGTSNSSGTINGTGSIVLHASQSWANNSDTQTLTIGTGISPSGGTRRR